MSPSRCAFLLVAFWIFAAPARGAVVLKKTLEQLTERADLIVVAQVQSTQSAWKGGRLITFTQLKALETLKGQTSFSVLVQQPGGAADGIIQDVPGTARFTLGEQVLVFLQKPKQGEAYLVLGLSSGKVTFRKTATGAKKEAFRDLHGIRFADDKPVVSPRVHPLGEERLGDAEALLNRIRQAAKPQKESK